MKGVLGLLLVAVGLEVAYLVLAGKLPLQIKTAKTGGGGTGGGGDTPLDIRKFARFGTPMHNRAPRGIMIPEWGGLSK